MNYAALRDSQREEIDNFPFFIALTPSQLHREIKKRGWNENDVCSVEFGCYTLKESKANFFELLNKHKKERFEFAKNFDDLVDMIVYEMEETNYVNALDEEGTTENILWNIDEDIQKLDRFDEAWIKAEEIVEGKA